ncbi:MAG TPA: DUF6624 domain-containing protein [Pyrinomonadaceae bacterium]
MPRELRSKIASVVFTIAVSLTGALAQEPKNNCTQIGYSERLTNPHRYRLKTIEGQAVYGEVSEKGELVSASGVCIALFNKTDKLLIANAKTESGGQFKFADVAPGKYVLILSVSALHEIVIPVEIDDSPRAHLFKRWGLLLHLRSREDRKESFVTPITQLGVREELLNMVREDQAIRNDLIKKGADHPDKAIEARMAVIDSNSTTRLKDIVRRYGWPDPERVGADGAEAAFLILQHSPELAFQKAMLPLVRKSFERGKLSAWNYSLLLDRVLMLEGKPQIYGSAIKPWVGKEPVPYPIEDEANVDKRRASIGLPPLREYLESLKRQYFPE